MGSPTGFWTDRRKVTIKQSVLRSLSEKGTVLLLETKRKNLDALEQCSCYSLVTLARRHNKPAV